MLHTMGTFKFFRSNLIVELDRKKQCVRYMISFNNDLSYWNKTTFLPIIHAKMKYIQYIKLINISKKQSNLDIL